MGTPKYACPSDRKLFVNCEAAPAMTSWGIIFKIAIPNRIRRVEGKPSRGEKILSHIFSSLPPFWKFCDGVINKDIPV